MSRTTNPSRITVEGIMLIAFILAILTVCLWPAVAGASMIPASRDYQARHQLTDAQREVYMTDALYFQSLADYAIEQTKPVSSDLKPDRPAKFEPAVAKALQGSHEVPWVVIIAVWAWPALVIGALLMSLWNSRNGFPELDQDPVPPEQRSPIAGNKCAMPQARKT